MRGSISTDRSAEARQRSGERETGRTQLLDFYAHTQSAEADMIEAEDRAEQQTAKRDFARLLGLYYKKILSPVEFKFLAVSIRTKKTPYEIGRALGVEYVQTIESINAKHKTNLPKLKKLMQISGYDNRRGLVLLPEWAKYIKIYNYRANYNAEHREKISEYLRRYYYKNRENISAYKRSYYKKHCEKIKAKARLYREEHREELMEKDKRYYYKNRENISAYKRSYYEEHREEIKAKSKLYYEARKAAKHSEKQKSEVLC